MNRREFLQVSAAAVVWAGCGDSTSVPVSYGAPAFSETDVVAGGPDGSLFRAVPTANTVSRFDSFGVPLWTVGKQGTGPLEFDAPVALTADARGRLLVLDRGNGRVQILDAASGQYLGSFGRPGTGAGQFHLARDIAASSDRIVVVDQLEHCVELFDYDLRPVGRIGGLGVGDGELNAPRGVALDRDGNVYVSDSGGGRIQRYSRDGRFLGRVDGQHVANPRGIAIDANDRLWVADGNARRLVVLTHEGELVETIATVLPGGAPAAPHAIAIRGADVFVHARVHGLSA